jgi:small multidrug resistance pump
MLSLALQTLSLGVTYAIWGGLGIVLVTLAGVVVYGQRVDVPALLGMGLIIGGVAVIHLFSQTVSQT